MVVTNGSIELPKWKNCVFNISIDGTKEYYEKIRGLKMFLMMVVWFLVIVGLVLFFSKLFQIKSGDSRKSPLNSAMDILNERYARGEINTVEFKAKKRDLAG